MKEAPTLKIQVEDVVVVREGTAPGAAIPMPSPYFQPSIEITVERETKWVKGKPRGPTVTIDMGDLMAAFE